MSGQGRLLLRREVEGRIADGELIVIHEGHAIRLDNWIDKHPGGRMAILHMVGRDATDEINAYHFDQTLRCMKYYRIGRVRGPWINFEPPIRGGAFRHNDDVGHGCEGVAVEVASDTSETDETSAGSFWGADSASASALLKVPGSSVPNTSVSSLGSDAPDDDKDVVGQAFPTADCDTGDGPTTCSQRLPFVAGSDHVGRVSVEAAVACPIKDKSLSRAAYTAAMEQKEVSDGIRDYPSLDVGTQQAIAREYQTLHDTIKAEGFYQCRYSEYGKEALRWGTLFSIFLYLLSIEWYLTSACFLGAFWQQIMFTAHDAGHRGITGHFITDTVIGAFVADFCCGLSIGWWKSSHNVHHLITNMPEHDPDIQNIPLFSTSPTFFKSITSSFYSFQFVWDAAADYVVPYQKYTYYPVMAIARFNLYLLSWLHLCSPRSMALGSAWWTRYLEIAFMACYWAIFGYGLLWCTLPNWPVRIGFVLISHCITMLLHVQITLSHWGMPTSDLGPSESFAQRQLRTTMDVDCPAWLDWLHGGLQFQAVHHLFPRVPRHNLRSVQTLVREFCVKTGLEYQCYGFTKGNGIVLSRLEEVAKMVDTLVLCQKHMQETGESGLH